MTESTFQKDSTLWISGFLILSILFVFGPVLRHDFITYDDPAYITQNEVVAEGLTWSGIGWAMTAVVSNNWHPLTMLSHMLDVQLFGFHAGLHHFESLLFHLANALLVFYVLKRMTGAVWRPALVAVLFALHPLRVESVAWASERKDVLSLFFWLLTMLAYLRYTEGRSARRYAVLALLFVLGLLSKSMLVTLPLVLLLLDYWPLQRIDSKDAVRRLVVEKVPLFGISLLFAGLTIYTQYATKATASLEGYPLWVRFANAIVSYGRYVLDTLAPYNLVIIYTHPGEDIVLATVLLSALVVGAITLGALYVWKSRPYITMGWFWYLITLLPVIGIIQVGSSSHADRYTYIPAIGLLIALVWTLGALVERWPRVRRPTFGAIALAILAYAGLSYAQVGLWRHDVTLFSRTIEVSPNSAKAHFALGVGNVKLGQHRRAAYYFKLSLSLNPNDLSTRKNLGAALIDIGRPDEAEAYFHDLILMDPYEKEHYVNLAISVYHQNKYDEAIFWAEDALRIDPAYTRASDLIQRCLESIPPEIPLEE